MIHSAALGTRELRDKFLRFFESKGHTQHPSGSLIPYDVTGRLDESLLFNGAGMVQFKPYFRGVAQPSNKRLTTAQKCVRTGDIEEVGDLTHLTFFEMLGNFSFGDYFKKDAIAYSWEFITSPEWLNLDPRRVSFTVFEDDDVAYENWALWLNSVGIDPETRIFRLGEDTNYWPAGAFSNGPPGPCGPNSEMFYWTQGEPPSGPYTREDWIRDEAESKWLEFWNDVFIQFEWQGELRNPNRPAEGYAKTGMPPLPFNSVDTGMGLERTATVLGGLTSLYDTDVFQPILRKIEEVCGNRSSTPQPPSYAYGSDPTKDVATRIIADHIRTAVFCIADGVLPGNSGRGYVLRRLIRRAVLKGQRVLGIEQPFFHRVYEGVLEGMGDHYSELHERHDVIVETLRNEEALFLRTLHEGSTRLDSYLSSIWALQVVSALAYGLATSPEAKSQWPNASERLRQLAEEFKVPGYVPKHIGDISGGQLGACSQLVRSSKELYPEFRKLATDFLCEHEKGPACEAIRAVTLNGRMAFELYDTYGFPFEVTKELCAEAGVEVDEVGYEEALLEAQQRSRSGSERESVYGGVQGPTAVGAAPTVFRGYDELRTQSHVIGAVMVPDPGTRASSSLGSDQDGRAPAHLAIALDQTPFYAESGGQVSDTGTLYGPGFEGRVLDVMKQNGVFVHEVEPVLLPVKLEGQAPEEAKEIIQNALANLEVEARVDENRRARIMRNHTATHLLHAALRQVLGKHVTQAGSYVGPDHLRFDFTHGKPLSPEELARVEFIVNEEALKNTPVTIYADLAIDEAKARGAMALFGEKYGDRVRMVEIGDFSRELCGGTHLRHTGEIGLFKVTSESSAASGVRRIEAVTGEGAYAWVLEQTSVLYEAAARIKSTPKDVLSAIDRMHEQLREERKRREKAEMALARGETGGGDQTQEVKGVFLWTRKFEDVDQKIAASAIDDAVAQNTDLVALGAIVADGRVQWIAKAGSTAVTKGAHSGNLVREVAKITGGGGGGRAEFATAGGKDASKVDAAMKAAGELLAAML